MPTCWLIWYTFLPHFWLIKAVADPAFSSWVCLQQAKTKTSSTKVQLHLKLSKCSAISSFWGSSLWIEFDALPLPTVISSCSSFWGCTGGGAGEASSVGIEEENNTNCKVSFLLSSVTLSWVSSVTLPSCPRRCRIWIRDLAKERKYAHISVVPLHIWQINSTWPLPKCLLPTKCKSQKCTLNFSFQLCKLNRWIEYKNLKVN